MVSIILLLHKIKINKNLIENYSKQFLLYEKVEREKNHEIIRDNIIEQLSIVYMQIDNLGLKTNDKERESDFKNLKLNVEEITKGISRYSRSILPINATEKNLSDNIQNLLKEYSRIYDIQVSCKVIGKEVVFSKLINETILGYIQDLINISQEDITTRHPIEVVIYYKKRKVNILFRSHSLDFKSGKILRSLNDRIHFIGGKLVATSSPNQTNNILISLPIYKSIYFN